MCKAIEEMIEEANENQARETARNLFLNGGNFELVKKSITVLSEDEITAIYEEVCGA